MAQPFMTTVYRSDSKTGLYVYLAKDKQISDLDDQLLTLLGKHTLVMELDLNSKEKLANEDIEKVKCHLKEQGYHVQLPHDIVKNVLNYR